MSGPAPGPTHREAELLAEIDLLRRQIAANSGAHRLALDDIRQETADVLESTQAALAAERRRTALLDLGDRLRDGSDPAAMATIAAQSIGRALGVARVGYGTVAPDGNSFTVERDWSRPGVSTSTGQFSMADFGRSGEELRRGEMVIVGDAGPDAATAAMPVRAVVRLPVMEGGRTVAVLCVADTVPRDWTVEELAFARDAAERTRDAIERRRAEQGLQALTLSLEQQVEERTRERDRLWRLSRDPFLIADADGRWLNVNPAWTEILGWSAEELVGRTSEWMEHPEDREVTRAEVTSLAGGSTTHRFENRFRAKDGRYHWFSWTAAPGDGLLFCVARDVTAEREQAAERTRLEDQLRQSQKMEAVGQLTGGVAHDFNNLLTIIRSSVDLLRRPDLPEPRRRRYIDAVSDTVDRAAKLTGQLLAFARRQALNPEVFDVGVRLRSIADMLDTVTGARIRVEAVLPDQTCLVRADLSQFETALVNLAVNARDAMDGEGVLTLELRCGAAMPLIRGHAGAVGPFAAVTLTDTGCGIAADQIARIFEPFFTTKEVGKGTGLGLSQVFGFTKQSGGDVAVESVVGVGTTFTLYLPEVATGAEPRPAAAIEAGPSPRGGGRRVLVVEDNVEVGRFSTQILQDLGYETTWAANAEEALDKIGADGTGFDVVFSDVVMPGMGGIELAKELRRRLPDMPVVLASGYSHVLAEEGAHGFELLHKPYSAEQLSRTLRRITRAAQVRGVGDARAVRDLR